MPNEFVLSGMLYYLTREASQQEKEDFLSKCERHYNSLPKREKHLMRDLNHYLVKDYCGNGNAFYDPENMLKFGFDTEEKKGEVVALLNEYRKLCQLRNDMNHATARKHNANGFFCYMRNKRPGERLWQDSSNINYEVKLRDYLEKWERLARQVPDEIRNNVLDLS